MCNEATKAAVRRARHPRFANRYFVGAGIDIGCGHDSIDKHRDKFPNMTLVTNWDQLFGSSDATLMDGVPDAKYDWVHSAHCLEHLADHHLALSNWLRILRPGGYLIVVVPEANLYEQGVWPSTFNGDHKHTFTLNDNPAWSPVNVRVIDLMHYFTDRAHAISAGIHDEGHVYGGERVDQSGDNREVDLEFVWQKH